MNDPKSIPADARRRAASHPAREVERVATRSVGSEGAVDGYDWVAVEAPLEIRAWGPGQEPASVAVTMRTPGSDLELAVGFLRTEGLIGPGVAVVEADCRLRAGVAGVALSRPFDGSSLRRNFPATSSCGVCGKATLDQVTSRRERIEPGPTVARATILGLAESLRAAQRAFDRTGGIHAAGLFDADGRLLAAREDVGRHNAVDKLVGRAFLDGDLPFSERILMVSGRTSFEILQKAAVAGAPIVCAVSAPSSLAVAVADQLGITLIGFLHDDRFNIYSHPGRVVASSHR
mgnify:CR=1 FL=1